MPSRATRIQYPHGHPIAPAEMPGNFHLNRHTANRPPIVPRRVTLMCRRHTVHGVQPFQSWVLIHVLRVHFSSQAVPRLILSLTLKIGRRACMANIQNLGQTEPPWRAFVIRGFIKNTESAAIASVQSDDSLYAKKRCRLPSATSCGPAPCDVMRNFHC